MEKLEYEMTDSSVEKAEVKLKFAERRLGEVERIVENGGEINNNTISQVAIFTNSAIGEIANVKEEDKVALQMKIDEFSKKQLKMIASVREKTNNLDNVYLTYESEKKEKDKQKDHVILDAIVEKVEKRFVDKNEENVGEIESQNNKMVEDINKEEIVSSQAIEIPKKKLEKEIRGEEERYEKEYKDIVCMIAEKE
jgi:hypothetical protein